MSGPWDLQTALSGGHGRIQPGDTVWLRGGTYRGSYASSLVGTSTAPIVVRQYPGERATINVGESSTEALRVDGAWAVYWGFEITTSGTDRFGTAGSGTAMRPTGVYVHHASNVKLINLVLHDLGHGTYTENAAHNIEIYGWIIYNGGWEDGRRSDGHGIYIKNDGNGWKVARDNVIFNQFGYGIHAYTEATSGALVNIVLDGNVVFNSGTISSFDNNPNLQLGGMAVANNDSVTNNLLYLSPGEGWVNARIGFKTLLNGTAYVRNNYIVGGREAVEVGKWRNLSLEANTIASADQPTVFVRPNRYEAGRATIVIYNWSRQAAVPVDMRGVLPIGARYSVHNVQDFYGAPIARGVYRGAPIAIPMTGVAPPVPIGGSARPPIRTAPAFDVFILTS